MEYEKVDQLMKQWRLGFTSFPEEYIDFHKNLADTATQDLKDRGYTVHRQWVSTDGWFDGMKTTYLIVETPSGRLAKVSWTDSGRNGCWSEHYQNHGGSRPHKIEDL